MTGILLVFVALFWLVAAYWLARLITIKVPKQSWRVLLRAVLFLALVPLPLIDEIVGKQKFEQICREKAEISVDTQNTQGRTVWFGGSERIQTRLGMLEVVQAKRNYIDAKTQEPVYHYYRVEAKGGLLIRLLGISEGGTPLLFEGLCQPKNLATIDAQLGLTRINRPTSN